MEARSQLRHRPLRVLTDTIAQGPRARSPRFVDTTVGSLPTIRLMGPGRVLVFAFLIFPMALELSSCVVKRRLIVRAGASQAQQALLVADRGELLNRITDQFNSIQNLSATVDMTPALGTTEKSRVTEYKDVRGYLLFRKPADIRIIGLVPVLRNTAFDMVSMGATFKLSLPSRNEFIVGRNESFAPSSNKLETLRPQHFLEALLVRPFAPEDKTLLENFTDNDNAYYILHEIEETQPGMLDLRRNVWFSRVDLRIARQILFDKAGNILTDARYSDWRQFDDFPFPKHIEIDRPRDEYGVVLDVVKMDINKGVSDDKFVLNQPPGSTLRTVGTPPDFQNVSSTPKEAPGK
jgi:outer membrane lipoprotein-sorting protein